MLSLAASRRRAAVVAKQLLTSSKCTLVGRSESLKDMRVGSGVTFLHSMVRVQDLSLTIGFFNKLGLIETRRKDVEAGRFSLVFMATAFGEPEIELTHNWDEEKPYSGGRNFGHLAFGVDDIYKQCAALRDSGVAILRPPRDGRMAFVRSPDDISVELLQKGAPLPPQEPWLSMENKGEW